MAKFKKIEKEQGSPDFIFYCPGCKCDHGIWTTGTGTPIWQFNGNIETPTISPSIKIEHPSFKETHIVGEMELGVKGSEYNHICHSFITDGRIEYLSDCTHHLAGKTIELSDYE